MRDNGEKLEEDIKRNGIREKNNTNWKWVKAIRIKDWRFKTKQKGINKYKTEQENGSFTAGGIDSWSKWKSQLPHPICDFQNWSLFPAGFIL